MFVKQFYANFFHFGHLKIGHHVCNDLGVCGLQSCIFCKVYFCELYLAYASSRLCKLNRLVKEPSVTNKHANVIFETVLMYYLSGPACTLVLKSSLFLRGIGTAFHPSTSFWYQVVSL